MGEPKVTPRLTQAEMAQVVEVFKKLREWKMKNPNFKPRDKTPPPWEYFVYFIGSEDGPIKIGRSVEPLKRMKVLQAGHPHELKLLGVIRGGADLEFQIHDLFKENRLEGEWFKRDETLIGFMQHLEPLTIGLQKTLLRSLKARGQR